MEREPVRRLGQNNFRLAAEAGLHLLRIVDAEGVGIYRSLYRKGYSLKQPAEDMRQGLDDDTLRFLEVVAGRAIDGLQLYAKLAELRKSAGLAALFTEPPFNQVRSGDRPRVTGHYRVVELARNAICSIK